MNCRSLYYATPDFLPGRTGQGRVCSPQRLMPDSLQSSYVRPKGRTLQRCTEVLCGNSRLEKGPAGLKLQLALVSFDPARHRKEENRLDSVERSSPSARALECFPAASRGTCCTNYSERCGHRCRGKQGHGSHSCEWHGDRGHRSR